MGNYLTDHSGNDPDNRRRKVLVRLGMLFSPPFTSYGYWRVTILRDASGNRANTVHEELGVIEVTTKKEERQNTGSHNGSRNFRTVYKNSKRSGDSTAVLLERGISILDKGNNTGFSEKRLEQKDDQK